MKKNSVYIGLTLCLGLLLGYLIFGNSSRVVSKEADEHMVNASDQLWTCSMHPQIIRTASGDCSICGMDLVLAGTVNDGLKADQFKLTENAMALANIQTSVVGIGDLDKGLKFSGKITENKETNALQVAHFGGRIESLLVNSVGACIAKGQLIATVYSPELVAAQQELLTTFSLKKAQPELYAAVRNKLKLWKLSEYQINQIESSGKIRENFPVYATMSGTILEKIVETGDYIQQGQVIYKIANLKTVWAVFDAYENQIAQLKKGQLIRIHTNTNPQKDFDAVISFIDPILNTSKRTVQMRANLNNEEEVLKPGMFVEGIVSIKDQMAEDAILIPKSAVLWTGKRSLIYVKTQPDQPVFEMREVTLGRDTGNMYAIVDGLKKGEEIVVNGTFTVDAAAQLQGKKSMMKRRETGIPIDFQKEFIQSLSAYFSLKDALVASNPENASESAEEMLKIINQLDTSRIQTEELNTIQVLEEMLGEIISKKDLAYQRNYFLRLNENLSTLIKKLNVLTDIIYIQKCPMANHNNGGIWLSKEAKIKNPYFGDAMLTCGSVVDTL